MSWFRRLVAPPTSASVRRAEAQRRVELPRPDPAKPAVPAAPAPPAAKGPDDRTGLDAVGLLVARELADPGRNTGFRGQAPEVAELLAPPTRAVELFRHGHHIELLDGIAQTMESLAASRDKTVRLGAFAIRQELRRCRRMVQNMNSLIEG